jgi:hypothetical protein
MEWTVFRPGLFPNEFLPLLNLRSSSVVEAIHLLALATKNRSIQTGAQIIFMDVNG